LLPAAGRSDEGFHLTRPHGDRNTNPRLRDHQDCRTLTDLLFESLSGDDRALGRQQKFTKGDFLWTSNVSRHDVYFLKRGQVTILLNDSVGCELIVRIIRPGELFGELCFCSQQTQPRDDCAQASVDSEVFRIDLSAFLAFLRRHSGALEAFTFTFCKRLADAQGRIEVLSHRGAEARLGKLLLQLAGTRGLKSAKPEDPIRLTVGHDELARMAAMTRPHVSVTMSKLRSRGLVRYSRGGPLFVHIALLAKHLELRKNKAE